VGRLKFPILKSCGNTEVLDAETRHHHFTSCQKMHLQNEI